LSAPTNNQIYEVPANQFTGFLPINQVYKTYKSDIKTIGKNIKTHLGFDPVDIQMK